MLPLLMWNKMITLSDFYCFNTMHINLHKEALKYQFRFGSEEFVQIEDDPWNVTDEKECNDPNDRPGLTGFRCSIVVAPRD